MRVLCERRVPVGGGCHLDLGLRQAGLEWTPAAGDRFVMADPAVREGAGLDDVFVVSEMTVDVALNPEAARAYPFSRLTGPANVLVMPARHSASISVKLMQEMAGATVIGPILAGVNRPIQLCSTVSTANDILNMGLLAAAQVDRQGQLL